MHGFILPFSLLSVPLPVYILDKSPVDTTEDNSAESIMGEFRRQRIYFTGNPSLVLELMRVSFCFTF
jgi:hypothetical protein